METVCVTCGVEGFSDALRTCVKCQDSAEHYYCSREWPKNFENGLHYICYGCLPRDAEQSIPMGAISSPSNSNEVGLTKFVQEMAKESPLLENECTSCWTMNLDEFQKSGPVSEQPPIFEDGKSLEEGPISEDDYLPAQPLSEPIWKGSFSICSDKFSTVVAAHVSTKASFKVFEAARQLPALLSLKLHPQPQLWPKSFCRSSRTDGQIGLYFLPERERDERLYESLLDDIIDQDLALVAVIGNVELLVFTSLQLPQQFSRILGKHYLWGFFREKKCSPHIQSSLHHLIRCSNLHATTSNKVDDDAERPHVPLGNSDADEESNKFWPLTQAKEAAELSSKGLCSEGVAEKETNLTSSDNTSMNNEAYHQEPVELSTNTTGQISAICHQNVQFVDQQKPMEEPTHPGRHSSETGPSDQTGQETIMVYRDEKLEGQSSTFRLAAQSTGTSLHTMARALNESNSEESCTSDFRKKVGSHTITPSLAPILESIIERHGDIARKCPLSYRKCSALLEGICKTVKNFRGIPFTEIRDHHLNSLTATITDAERANIRVDWLRDVHDELEETMLILNNKCQPLKRRKHHLITSTKKACAMKKARFEKVQSDS